MDDWEGEEAVEQQEEQEYDEEYEMEDPMEGLLDMEEMEDDDPNYDWYGPSGGNEPISAPALVPIVPIRQKGPAKFVPLNMGGGKTKGKGKKGKGMGKGKNKGKSKGFQPPRFPTMPRLPMGHMTPITNPAIVSNPLRQQQQWEGGRPKGWTPPIPQMPPMAMRAPPMQSGVPNAPKMPGAGLGSGQMVVPPTIPQMIPFYGFTPFPVGQQPQPVASYQTMAMPSQPQMEHRDQIGKTRRHRKRKEQEDTSSMESSSVHSRKKKKKTHTVMLHVDGKCIPAKYRA